MKKWSGGSTSMRPLVSGSDAEDLSEVVDVLRANQVEFEYSESGDTILVPEDKRAAMRMELAMKVAEKRDVGFEIFDEGTSVLVTLFNALTILELCRESCSVQSQ